MSAIEQHITNWKRAVAGWDFTAWPEQIETDDVNQYRTWCRALNDATARANAAGHNTRARGTQDKKGGPETMWITAKGHTLKVAYAPRTTRQQAVTETSKAAYRKIDLTTQRGQIAAFILDKTLKQPDITRQEIAAWSGMQINAVCGRVRELLDEPVDTAAGLIQLKVVAVRKSNIPGATEKNEAVAFVPVVEKSEEKEVQMSMF